MNQVLRVRVSGRVQGVGFRFYTCRQARRLGLTGWVRNEYDGSVLVHIQGPESDVESLCRWLQNGPPTARVDEAKIIPAAFDGSLVDFGVSY